MTNTPTVSVIIPTHNRAAFLQVAIESVLRQSWQDFEVLVVDDASTDTTAEVVHSFSDPRIHYFRHTIGKGGAAARNTGIKNSKAPFLAFLDDDDEWLGDKLSRQLQLFQAAPRSVGAVYSAYQIVERASGKVAGHKTASKRGDLSVALLESNCVGGTSSVILRRECFEKVGLFDESLPSFQDYDLWIRISSHFDFDCVNEPLLKYYVHGKKIWSNVGAMIQGLEMMLKKHTLSPGTRKKYSHHFLSLGVQECNDGNTKTGRKALLTAIKLSPYEVRHYFYFGLCIFGVKIFRKTKAAKEKVLTALRGWTNAKPNAL